jgi:hypothetical protein
LSPILGIIASQNYPRITSSYESIATVSLGSSQATISFTSIPSTYKHLQIRAIAKATRTSSGQTTFRYQFNSDTATNYSYHRLFGDGSSTASDGGPNQNYGYFYFGANTNDTANSFGVSIWDIFDYTDTNKAKTTRFTGGLSNNNTTGGVGIGSSTWFGTSAVNSITIGTDGGWNFLQYSHFALYGIRG